jgi:sugar lactone lactonase YvrE
MKHSVQHIFPLQATLGECPVWSVQQQRLYCVDILAPAIHCVDPRSGQHQRLPVDEHIGCIGLRQQGGFIAAMRSGVYLLDAQGQKEKKLADNPTDPKRSRFNDGRVDAFGRFWCGTLWEPRDISQGKLCRIEANGECSVQAQEVMVSNGVAFSPAGDWLYHSDTPEYVIYRYPMDTRTGQIGARQRWVEFAHGSGGRPDGAAVDSQGYYWSAMFDGGRIVRIDPHSGQIVDEIHLPVRWPTMVAFGGADLRTLFITTSREHRSAEELRRYPQSGDLFAVQLDVAGCAEPLFSYSGL